MAARKPEGTTASAGEQPATPGTHPRPDPEDIWEDALANGLDEILREMEKEKTDAEKAKS